MISGMRKDMAMIALAAMTGLMGMSLMTGAAQAAVMTPDFNALSQTAPELPREGDFDGDGRTDQLMLVAEPNSGRIAVHIRLNTAQGYKDIRVTSFDSAEGAAPDVRVVHAGAYASDCGSYATDCTASIRAQHDSVLIGLDGGASLLVHWQAAQAGQAGQFEQDFVHSDEALMAHALSALYAMNR
ncbi:hypothetical protein [Asticcacaulis sp. EMRT-3]|uniref:hypothetical protein n=1 Tax=Asticcacaulis sp. EMRT-3 TaxID=3040349 RepID=UPI0024AFBAFE|nr:hypothetical protein [Asticcacaulis sp. EMRT-3]MDI7775498.1 hypothetical protein [Asticcacaulis sp. EMRT-3]